MAYGVLYGETGVNKIPLSRTQLAINNIVAGVGIVAGATPNTFVVGQTGLHQVDFDLLMNAPTNDTPFTVQLWNVTKNLLVQSRNGTAPQQSWPSDMYFGFEWDNTDIADEFAFYVTPNVNVAPNGFALLMQDLNFRATVQEFGGSGIGPGTAGRIAKFIAPNVIGDSIMTEAATTITVAGAVSLAGANNATFMALADGQNVAVSAANTGRIRYNAALQTFQFSENGGAWADLSGVGPGTVNRIAKFATANTVGDSTIADTGTAVTQTQTVATTGSPTAWTLNAAAHTTLTASTEATDVNYDLARTVQWATGDFGVQRAFRIQNPTYAFVGGSTITTAATLSIDGAPQLGLNTAITEPLALWVETGQTKLGGGVNITGAPNNYISQSVATTGTPTILRISGASHTTLAAGSEAIDIFFNLSRTVQHSAGGIGSQRAVVIGNPTYSFDGASTITTAATLCVEGAPQQGANCVITNAYAIWVSSGMTRLAGGISVAGATDNSITQSVATTGSPVMLTLTGGAHTTLTASVESIDVNVNLARTVQFSAGALATQRAVVFQAPTYSFTGASVLTNTATVAITNQPQQGANATFTNAYALWVQAGKTQLDGTTEVVQLIEKVNAKGNCTGNQTIDLTAGNVVTATLTGPGTWTITNPAPSGKSSTVTFILTNAGANITWAVTPKWAGGVPPTFSVAGTDLLIMTTVDGGTTWYASTVLALA